MNKYDTLRVVSSFMLAAVLNVACVAQENTPAVPSTPKPPASPAADAQKNGGAADTTKEITAVLTVQSEAWNAGDLEAFMTTYWKSPKLSFSSGGQTTYGWKNTLQRYRKGYAPPKEMGKLKFDQLEVSPLGPKFALALGHWHLTMKDGSKRDGNFSLVLKKTKAGWRIIHDHSSEEKPEEKPESSDEKAEKPE